MHSLIDDHDYQVNYSFPSQSNHPVKIQSLFTDWQGVWVEELGNSMNELHWHISCTGMLMCKSWVQYIQMKLCKQKLEPQNHKGTTIKLVYQYIEIDLIYTLSSEPRSNFSQQLKFNFIRDVNKNSWQFLFQNAQEEKIIISLKQHWIGYDKIFVRN